MISSLKEFTEFLKICRKQGVKSVTLAGVTVELGDLPRKQDDSDEKESREIPLDQMTPEQLMFYSAGIPLNEDNKV